MTDQLWHTWRDTVLYYRAVVKSIRDLWTEMLKEFPYASFFSSPVSVFQNWPRDNETAVAIPSEAHKRNEHQSGLVMISDMRHVTGCD